MATVIKAKLCDILARDICRILKIDPAVVAKIQITIEVGEPVWITVTTLADAVAGDELAQMITKKFRAEEVRVEELA